MKCEAITLLDFNQVLINRLSGTPLDPGRVEEILWLYKTISKRVKEVEISADKYIDF